MAANEIRLDAEARTEFGKGAARRIRRDHKIPAVLYGHGTDPVHLTLPGHETMLALKNPNAILTIVLEGGENLALAKDVQRDPIKPVIDHVDLVIVRRGEKVTVDVVVHVEGEAAPETNVIVENGTLSVEADAMSIPESLTVSVEGLEAGSQVLAKDVELPSGVSLAADEELLVVNVTQQISEEEMEAELAEAEAEAGIEHEESDEEAAEREAAEGEEGEGDGESEGSDDEGDSDKE
ncbi:50S ribosomal protein L25/general stress protein Ctc [Calidifontibacter sp. DB0510]|uniref:Large ribosomal subunit protein bL25 n=1 Tax=Metallococcus carri TaxID=1656884 RepID=A0A967EAA0_9MICO|nr:50S ribosomal protein L25/general stress protein Ctc [Metallococcus carri]NHN55669.1 50S ribosomal protein L25/general stress protein Ctc [Metallococcus carri]NOP38147.1 50S ribosomal protein L25/general stress protein Ctc [Calidifontibacter sp. DB2511S]